MSFWKTFRRKLSILRQLEQKDLKAHTNSDRLPPSLHLFQETRISQQFHSLDQGHSNHHTSSGSYNASAGDASSQSYVISGLLCLWIPFHWDTASKLCGSQASKSQDTFPSQHKTQHFAVKTCIDSLWHLCFLSSGKIELYEDSVSHLHLTCSSLTFQLTYSLTLHPQARIR